MSMHNEVEKMSETNLGSRRNIDSVAFMSISEVVKGVSESLIGLTLIIKIKTALVNVKMGKFKINAELAETATRKVT